MESQFKPQIGNQYSSGGCVWTVDNVSQSNNIVLREPTEFPVYILTLRPEHIYYILENYLYPVYERYLEEPLNGYLEDYGTKGLGNFKHYDQYFSWIVRRINTVSSVLITKGYITNFNDFPKEIFSKDFSPTTKMPTNEIITIINEFKEWYKDV